MALHRSYTKPLAEWISLSLNKDSLESVVAGIRSGVAPKNMLSGHSSNSRYIAKLLREEVVRQFRETYRPLVEVITNAVDARTGDASGTYTIDCRTKWGGTFVVQDHGKSMSLEEMLTLLIIPFATNKDPSRDIGRFGVGFLSTLNYCLENQGMVKVTCITDKDAYSFRFWSPDENAENLHLTVKRSARFMKKPGTKVVITNAVSRKKRLFNYIEEQLKSFPPNRARIYVNGTLTNPEFWGAAYYSGQSFVVRGRETIQDVGVIINHDFQHDYGKNGNLLVTSQGIKVEAHPLKGSNIKIDFPPAVLLVEGRDELKRDENYSKALAKVFELVAVHIRKQSDNAAVMAEMPDTVASMAGSLGMSRPVEMPHYPAIREALFGRAEYIATRAEARSLRNFFGQQQAGLFYGASEIGTPFWSQVFKPAQLFVDEHIKFLQVLDPGDFAPVRRLQRKEEYAAAYGEEHTPVYQGFPSPKDTPNLDFAVKDFLPSLLLEKVNLRYMQFVKSDFNDTASPFLAWNNLVIVNTTHALFRARNIWQSYLVSNALGMAMADATKTDYALGGSHERVAR